MIESDCGQPEVASLQLCLGPQRHRQGSPSVVPIRRPGPGAIYRGLACACENFCGPWLHRRSFCLPTGSELDSSTGFYWTIPTARAGALSSEGGAPTTTIGCRRAFAPKSTDLYRLAGPLVSNVDELVESLSGRRPKRRFCRRIPTLKRCIAAISQNPRISAISSLTRWRVPRYS